MSVDKQYHAQAVRLDDGSYEGRLFPFNGPYASTSVWRCGHQHEDQNEARTCAHAEKAYRTGRRTRPPEPTGPRMARAIITGTIHLMQDDGFPLCGSFVNGIEYYDRLDLDALTCGNCKSTIAYRDLVFEESL